MKGRGERLFFVLFLSLAHKRACASTTTSSLTTRNDASNNNAGAVVRVVLPLLSKKGGLERLL